MLLLSDGRRYHFAGGSFGPLAVKGHELDTQRTNQPTGKGGPNGHTFPHNHIVHTVNISYKLRFHLLSSLFYHVIGSVNSNLT